MIAFVSLEQWNAWLDIQPATSRGVWLKLAKAGSGAQSLTKQEAIDGALCHGWIDGPLKPYDDRHWLVRSTPRRPESKWSSLTATAPLSSRRLVG